MAQIRGDSRWTYALVLVCGLSAVTAVLCLISLRTVTHNDISIDARSSTAYGGSVEQEELARHGAEDGSRIPKSSAPGARDLLLVVVSALLGILSSFSAWWIVSRRLVPKVTFNDSMSVTVDPNDPDRYRMRVKAYNSGKRDIIDFTAELRVSLPGRYAGYPGNITNLTFRLTTSPLMRFPKKTDRIFLIRSSSLDPAHRGNLPTDVLNALDEGDPAFMKKLLELSTRAKFRIQGTGNDVYSGTRKFFVSNDMDIDNVRVGTFVPGTVKGPPLLEWLEANTWDSPRSRKGQREFNSSRNKPVGPGLSTAPTSAAQPQRPWLRGWLRRLVQELVSEGVEEGRTK